MSKKTISSETAEGPQPISPLYIIARPRGKAQLFADGWHCDCGGDPANECEHIQKAKVIWGAVRAE